MLHVLWLLELLVYARWICRCPHVSFFETLEWHGNSLVFLFFFSNVQLTGCHYDITEGIFKICWWHCQLDFLIALFSVVEAPILDKGDIFAISEI